MRAGNLRHSVVIERPAEARPPASGALVTKFRKLFETRASIVPLTGRELFAAQQVQAEVTTRISFRWRPVDVDATCRVRTVSGDQIYDILAVLPDATARREIMLLCILRTSEGWRRGG